jgi:hypothetical protein
MFEALTARARCSSCGAPIAWVKMIDSRKANPMNPNADPERGNVAVKNNMGRTLKKAELEQARAEGTVLYLSHFATCPNGKSHKKAKQPAKAEAEA